ncbi:hypothetical protein L1049_018395 [Liquidambar formosana]|uniref:Auxin-responsive protein n=1 Tax=Liquidambar formosana TaxID=63359 RepID=A0AAP0RA15_LIQFO
MEGCPKLFSLIPKDREWHVRENEGNHGVSEDKKLELRLGPPGEAQFIKQNSINDHTQIDHSLLCFANFSSMSSNTHNTTNTTTCGAKRGFAETVGVKTGERNWLTKSEENLCQKLSSSEKPVEKVISTTWSCGPIASSISACQRETQKLQQQPKPSFHQLQYPLISKSLAVMAEKSSNPCSSTRVAELQYQDKKACSTPSKTPVSANTAAPNSSHKRVAPAPVVGWPPIRSFRKNLAYGSSLKPASESPTDIPKEVVKGGESKSFENGWFVKINMDGVPIGRKVDLNAYESYEKLSSAVDELFRGLLAAQRDSSDQGGGENEMDEKMITGLLDGSGEYTLVYEDNEGDRMLVGDVPWHMFVSTVKRLRVLKKSELSALCICSSKQEKISLDSAMEFGR